MNLLLERSKQIVNYSSTILGSLIIVFTSGVASISIIMVGVLMFVTWGVSAIYYLEVLGVGVGDYWIWAVPCYLCIVFAMIYGITGIGLGMKKKEA